MREKSSEIDRLLSDKMKDGPPEEEMAENFRKKLEEQRMAETPESMEEAIMLTPITAVVGIDQKTKRPIYQENFIGDAIHSG